MKNLFVPLKKRSVIKITGKDKRDFLQGLLSNDLNKLSETQPLYALLLTPQGKYLADFFIAEKENAFFCDIPIDEKDNIIKRLTMYKLRSDVAIRDETTRYEVVALMGENLKKHIEENSETKPFCKGIVYLDPRKKELGARSFIERENKYQSFIVHDFAAGKNAIYKEVLLTLAIPNEEDLISGESFPLEYGLDKLNAIDFNKGCYVGQEVTARTHHRGTPKKGLYCISGEKLPAKGDTVTDKDNNKLGIMLSHNNTKGLALLRHKETQEANYEALHKQFKLQISS